jgi:predicted  nucleic acid-binding Zn-ribbon protein
MAETLAAQSGAGGSMAEGVPELRRGALDRLASFRIVYLAIFAFAVAYIATIEIVENVLNTHFQNEVRIATRVSPADGPIQPQIQQRVSAVVQNSVWTRLGGVRVNVTVIGSDGQTPLYVGGGAVVPPPPPANLDAAMREALNLLPAISDVFVSVPTAAPLSTGILVLYGAILLQGLFLYNRRLARREQALVAAAVAQRDASATRAAQIEGELASVRERLGEIEPTERAHVKEIRELENERKGLRRKLRELAEREAELRTSAERASDLEQERQALEELLEEALEDVGQKEGEISSLQDRLKNTAKREPSGGRTRESERLERRLRTLYRNLEFDDRAISDLIGLRDEAMRLRAEESIKRLDDDPDTAAIRRKVGGLPPQLSIFELGFAGKGRIYYTRGEKVAYRILAVGAKNSQKQDLEYLSRLK